LAKRQFDWIENWCLTERLDWIEFAMRFENSGLLENFVVFGFAGSVGFVKFEQVEQFGQMKQNFELFVLLENFDYFEKFEKMK
jgi:hypothetical protein